MKQSFGMIITPLPLSMRIFPMTFFNNICTSIILAILTIGISDATMAHTSASSHQHQNKEISISIGEYNFLVVNDEMVSFTLKSGQTLSEMCTQTSFLESTCSRSILLENKEFFNSTWTKESDIDIRVAKRIRVGQSLNLPKRFGEIVKAKITQKKTPEKSTESLEPTITEASVMTMTKPNGGDDFLSPAIQNTTNNDSVSIAQTSTVNDSRIMLQKEADIEVSPKKIIPLQEKQGKNSFLEENQQSIRIVILGSIILLMGCTIIFLLIRGASTRQLREESRDAIRLKNENDELREELAILKELFTEQKTYSLKSKDSDQKETVYRIIPTLEVSNKGSQEKNVVTPHQFIAQFKERFDEEDRLPAECRKINPEIVLLKTFRGKVSPFSPLHKELYDYNLRLTA